MKNTAKKNVKFSLKKKIATVLTAAVLALPLSYSTISTPSASAGTADIIGAVLGGIQASSEANALLKKYDQSEEGRQIWFDYMKKKNGVNPDPNLNQRLERIMTNLSKAVAAVDPSIHERPYNYFVNKDKSFNAFCSLGHNMSVNTGTFYLLPSEDELAFVIGHEMGHGQKNHVAKGINKSIWIQAAGQATGTGILGEWAAEILDSTQNTKPQEKEADKLAFEYITHTNYNPAAGAALWQRVMEKMKSSPSSWQRFTSDHPSDDARRDVNSKYVADYSGGHVTAKDGIVYVNGQTFVKPAAHGDMSGAERSYFVQGNLAAAFHNKHNEKPAYTEGNIVMLGDQPIISCSNADESAAVLADRLNAIKDSKSVKGSKDSKKTKTNKGEKSKK